MARTVEDSARLFSVLSGWDPSALFAPDFTDNLVPLRIGYAHNLARFLPSVQKVMEGAVTTLETLGAQVVPIDLEVPEEVSKAEYQVLLYEFKEDLERYLRTYGAPFTGLEGLILYNLEHQDRVLPYFGQEIFVEAQAQGPKRNRTTRKPWTFAPALNGNRA